MREMEPLPEELAELVRKLVQACLKVVHCATQVANELEKLAGDQPGPGNGD